MDPRRCEDAMVRHASILALLVLDGCATVVPRTQMRLRTAATQTQLVYRKDISAPSRAAPSPPLSPAAATPSTPPGKRISPGQGTGILAWPLRGVLYAPFGKRGSEIHDGIDIAAPKGMTVRSAAAGRVRYAGAQRAYGNIVIIDHGDNLVTLYAHNDTLLVNGGEMVNAGQPVATVGESGQTTGPHLHFEVRRSGIPINPIEVLGKLPAK